MIEFPPQGSVPVSVLIPVKNEEENIQACLASVNWASEVVVVDSSSQDRTAEIALAAGASVVQFIYQRGGPKKKNWALETVRFRNDWILILHGEQTSTA